MNKEQRIPKTLHYVWVGGGKMSDKMLMCIESWKKFCPDYEIKEWNEHNFDMTKSPLLKRAMETRNWALVADIMRVFILHENGGIYVDTDIEIIKPMDEFLTNDFFMGYEGKFWVNTAIIGSIRDHAVFGTLSKFYSSDLCLDISNLFTVHVFSALLAKLYNIPANGKTKIFDNGIAVYRKEYFYPIDYLSTKKRIKENTHAIHHYAQTWFSPKSKKTLNFWRKALKFLLIPPITRPFEWLSAKVYRRRANKKLRQLDKI